MGRHIQVETALRSHPKFRRLCRLAGLSERDGIGALASLWLNVREVCPDGKMPGWTADDLDDAAETPGLSQHLLSVGFVDESETGLECHDWPDHSGRQCRDAERKAQERLEKSMDCPRTVQGVSMPRARAREGRGREGNGQEESKSTPLPADAGGELVLPIEDGTCTPQEWEVSHEEFYSAYPRKVQRPDSERAWRKIKPQDHVTFNAIMDGLEAWTGFWGKKVERDKIPYPATWLNARQWNDQP